VIQQGALLPRSYAYGHKWLFAQAGGTPHWYLADALGSVRTTLNDAGDVLTTASYDPWGVPQGSRIAPWSADRHFRPHSVAKMLHFLYMNGYWHWRATR
jgi:hypothetical protein